MTKCAPEDEAVQGPGQDRQRNLTTISSGTTWGQTHRHKTQAKPTQNRCPHRCQLGIMRYRFVAQQYTYGSRTQATMARPAARTASRQYINNFIKEALDVRGTSRRCGNESKRVELRYRLVQRQNNAQGRLRGQPGRAQPHPCLWGHRKVVSHSSSFRASLRNVLNFSCRVHVFDFPLKQPACAFAGRCRPLPDYDLRNLLHLGHVSDMWTQLQTAFGLRYINQRATIHPCVYLHPWSGKALSLQWSKPR